MNSFQRAFMTAIACLCFSVTAFAQTWPQRAIKVIAPYPPGGPSDIVIRTVSDKVQAALKQAVIIENIPGAGGNIGSAAAARAPHSRRPAGSRATPSGAEAVARRH
jgi:tripartite-type tricarboxylate transporter receptor subunit TctC